MMTSESVLLRFINIPILDVKIKIVIKFLLELLGFSTIFRVVLQLLIA